MDTKKEEDGNKYAEIKYRCEACNKTTYWTQFNPTHWYAPCGSKVF